jgi:hypothetical protein
LTSVHQFLNVKNNKTTFGNERNSFNGELKKKKNLREPLQLLRPGAWRHKHTLLFLLHIKLSVIPKAQTDRKM